MARRYLEIAVLHVWFQRRQEDSAAGWRKERPVRLVAQEDAASARAAPADAGRRARRANRQPRVGSRGHASCGGSGCCAGRSWGRRAHACGLDAVFDAGVAGSGRAGRLRHGRRRRACAAAHSGLRTSDFRTAVSCSDAPRGFRAAVSGDSPGPRPNCNSDGATAGIARHGPSVCFGPDYYTCAGPTSGGGCGCRDPGADTGLADASAARRACTAGPVDSGCATPTHSCATGLCT